MRFVNHVAAIVRSFRYCQFSSEMVVADVNEPSGLYEAEPVSVNEAGSEPIELSPNKLKHLELMKFHRERLRRTEEQLEAWRNAGLNIPDLPIKQLKSLAQLHTPRERLMNNAKIKKSDGWTLTDAMRHRWSTPCRTAGELQRRGRLLSALRCDGPSLVFDFSMTNSIDARERRELIPQMWKIFTANVNYRTPFVLHLCSIDKSLYWKKFTMSVSRTPESDVRYFETEKHYLDIFPAEKLVYLTHDSPNTLPSFDADKIYIIGALVDFRNLFSTYEKATAEGIATAKLPIDLSKLPSRFREKLSLTEVFHILLDLYSHDSSCELNVERNLIAKRFAEGRFFFELNSDQKKQLEELVPFTLFDRLTMDCIADND